MAVAPFVSPALLCIVELLAEAIQMAEEVHGRCANYATNASGKPMSVILVVSLGILAFMEGSSFGELNFSRSKHAVHKGPVGGGFKEVLYYVGPQHGIAPLSKPGALHSQVGQDWLVGSLLGCKTNGFFIDLASNDAQELSNTLALERTLNWTGLCIEANPLYIPGLLHRDCKIVSAVVGSPTDETVMFNFDGVMGGIVGADLDNKDILSSTRDGLRQVSFRHLLSVVGVPSMIDFLSLDVEGAESVVMNDFPWSTTRFSVITVERPKADLKLLLQEHGYKFLRVNSVFDDETWVDAKLHAQVQLEFGATSLPTHTCMQVLAPRQL